MILRTLTLAAMVAATGLPAFAAEPQPGDARGAVLFWMLDRNSDRIIDRNEIAALRAAIFDALDTDHDGRLTKAEAMVAAAHARDRVAGRIAAIIKAGPAEIAERRAMMAARLGLDQPGGVARDTFIAADMPLFARADADQSGTISRDEFAAAAGVGADLLAPR